MSMIRRAICALIVLSVLAFQTVSRAETPETKEGQPNLVGAVVSDARDRVSGFVATITTPVVSVKELQCLARNIFFEAANEPEEGKVAVGLVTLNRVQDGRFGKSVCGVVDQKTVFSVPRQITIEKRQLFKTVKETHTVYTKQAVCQFSWRCMFVKTPKSQDERWVESQEIARTLLTDAASYGDYRDKYENALYFHAISVRPTWSRLKHHVSRIGGHHFYADRDASRM